MSIRAGTVTVVRMGLVEAAMPALPVGSGVSILPRGGSRIAARVIAARSGVVTLAPFAGIDGVAAGDAVREDRSALNVCLGTVLLGRACDASGTAIDGGPVVEGPGSAPARDVSVLQTRRAIGPQFMTGVRAIDGPLAFGVGARLGIFGAPGCGKSTLLETIVAGSSADVTVVGLIGERGREAQRWLAQINERTTIICATSDRSAAERVRAAEIAFAQADVLRQRGLDVLLVLDSLARTAAAARDIAIAAGEPVGRGGYPASVFTLLAKLLERAGSFASGSITLLVTVLSDGSDERDPVSDACRAALDGHIALSERLARQGWFPAIDLPASTSRTLAEVASPEHAAAARILREAVAILDETREARQFGLEAEGSDSLLARALSAQSAITAFLRQSGPDEPSATLTKLKVLTDMLSNGYIC